MHRSNNKGSVGIFGQVEMDCRPILDKTGRNSGDDVMAVLGLLKAGELARFKKESAP